MITKDQVQHIAKLARLELSAKELEKYQHDLAEILEYFEVLKEKDTSNVQPMTHSVFAENVEREDRAQKETPDTLGRLTFLMPIVKDGFLKVKSIFSDR